MSSMMLKFILEMYVSLISMAVHDSQDLVKTQVVTHHKKKYYDVGHFPTFIFSIVFLFPVTFSKKKKQKKKQCILQ